MTNLSDDGKLEKTKDFTMSNYGKKEHLWCLPKKPLSLSVNQHCLSDEKQRF